MFHPLICLVIAAAAFIPAVASAQQHAPAATKFIPLDGLGDHHFPISAAAPQSQRLFDQGIRLAYAFNHDEALHAFQAIEDVDPFCAMAQWGIAYVLGPNYNLPADPERDAQAHAALEKARRFSRAATPREVDYIAALSKRYATRPEEADRRELDNAYAEAMRELANKYPDDLDAATLYAEALMNLRPWDLWTADGKPQPGTEQIVATFERVLEKNPRHPGANHFYIHAVEASPFPERGLPSAERLGDIAPAAGHLVHMPSHIYLRLGRYSAAAESNRRAVAADRAYIAKYRPTGIYAMMYYPHNIHFLWSACCFAGRRGEALAAAADLAQAMPNEAVRAMPMIEGFVPTRLFTLVRFGLWEEVLKSPAPAEDFPFATAIWHYARAMAEIETGNLEAAQLEIHHLRAARDAMPAERMAMQHRMVDLLSVALAISEGKYAARRGDTDAAVAHLAEAVRGQDALKYDEPPPWYYPARQSLGAVLLAAGRATEAEKVYREDLARYPENGWSLFGLAASLRAQNSPESDAVQKRFEKVWAESDVVLRSSEY